MRERILITGLPRSGTTWVGQVLGRAEDCRYVHEPDNHLMRPEAWRAKRTFGAHPALSPDQEAAAYQRLWAIAFAGGSRPSPLYAAARLLHRAVPRCGDAELGKRSAGAATAALEVAAALAAHRRLSPIEPAGPVVVKSVHCSRSLEWLSARFAPRVVVLDRHPFGIIASWAALGWTSFLDRDPAALRYSIDVLEVAPPRPDAAWIKRAAWQYGLLTSYLRRALARHPAWEVVTHEALCSNPEAGFVRLGGRLGLTWTEEAQRFLLASNRPGDGYSTNRVWAEQIDGGRARLNLADQERVLEVLSAFPAMVAPAAATAGLPGGEAPAAALALKRA